ncbi:MAG TPA: hypothetical protein VGF59_18035 [Bryobacteraceae bacterium]
MSQEVDGIDGVDEVTQRLAPLSDRFLWRSAVLQFANGGRAVLESTEKVAWRSWGISRPSRPTSTSFSQLDTAYVRRGSTAVLERERTHQPSSIAQRDYFRRTVAGHDELRGL